jgi:hypothetical protein
MPSEANDPAEFKCKTLIFRQFDRSRQSEIADLITVTRAGNMGDLETAWRDAGELFKALRKELGDFRVSWEGVELGFDLVNTLLNRDVPVINLKQMRDSEQTQLACYQALVEAKLEITGFHGAGPLTPDYEVTFCDCDSHAIVRDFGFKLVDGKMRPRFAFWAEIDFNAPAGTIVWQAP